MTEPPLPEIGISVIVPVYNDPADLRLCLEALQYAATPDCEIIVVDDGSTDETPAVASGLGVHVVALAKNSGPAAARNRGARSARGAILFFVDADVVIAPRAIERVQRFFAEHAECAAVFGSYDARRCTGVCARKRQGRSQASRAWSRSIGTMAIARSWWIPASPV